MLLHSLRSALPSLHPTIAVISCHLLISTASNTRSISVSFWTSMGAGIGINASWQMSVTKLNRVEWKGKRGETLNPCSYTALKDWKWWMLPPSQFFPRSATCGVCADQPSRLPIPWQFYTDCKCEWFTVTGTRMECLPAICMESFFSPGTFVPYQSP